MGALVPNLVPCLPWGAAWAPPGALLPHAVAGGKKFSVPSSRALPSGRRPLAPQPCCSGTGTGAVKGMSYIPSPSVPIWRWSLVL